MNEGVERIGRRRRWLWLGLSLTFAIWFWTSGALGRALACWVLPRIPPFPVGRALQWRRAACGKPPPVFPFGATLTIRPSRLEALARSAAPWTRWVLPPGLLRDGFWVCGLWMPSEKLADGTSGWPLCLVIHDRCAPPRLSASVPIREFNQLFQDLFEEKFTKEGEWLLGTYERTYRLTFFEARVFSDESAETAGVPASRYPGKTGRSVRLRVTARGLVRVVFRDHPMKATVTGRVRSMEGWIDVRPRATPEGQRISYEVRIEKMDVDVSHLLPWGDEKVGDFLRQSLEESWNKPKKKKKIENKIWPSWIPTDARLDLTLR